jgi:hypothetical protein
MTLGEWLKINGQAVYPPKVCPRQKSSRVGKDNAEGWREEWINPL